MFLELLAVEGDAHRTVTAPYLIGCDGASSFVRRTLGILTSLGYDQDWLVIDVLVDDTALLPLPLMQICDPERPRPTSASRTRTGAGSSSPARETREEMERPEAIDAPRTGRRAATDSSRRRLPVPRCDGGALIGPGPDRVAMRPIRRRPFWDRA